MCIALLGPVHASLKNGYTSAIRTKIFELALVYFEHQFFAETMLHHLTL